MFSHPIIEHNTSPGLWAVLLSVLASMFGVQSHSNYERDFKHGRMVSYIIIGVIIVTFLVLGLMLIVKLILA